MKFKKTLLVFCLIMCILFTISSIAAGDVNDTAIASENTNQIELSSNNEITEDNLQTSEENTIIAQTNDNETVTAEIDSPTFLSASTGTFDDLQVEINNAPEGSVLNLTRDYIGHYGSRIDFRKDLTIDGQGHSLDCLGDSCGAFYSSSGNIVLKNLTIINGQNDLGGAIYITGSATYTIIDCIFENNEATDGYGGAIYNEANNLLTIKNSTFKSNKGGTIRSQGDLYVENSTFIANTIDTFSHSGGAIDARSKSEIYNCVFDSNEALDTAHGGAIYANDETKIVNSTFKNNLAEWTGGAISASGVAFIDGCLFEHNIADGMLVQDSSGGAINSDGDLYINNSTFKDNWADDYGGAISCHKLYINFDQDDNQPYNTFFINNEADDSSGGAIITYDSVYIKNTEFSSNEANVDGGAIYTVLDRIDGYATVVNLTHCLFDSNKVDSDGSQCYGGAIRAKGLFECYDCIFSNNVAEDCGGAIYVNYGFADSCIFKNNRADEDDGGAIYTEEGMRILNSIFEANCAYVDGGAIYSKERLDIINDTFVNNYADGASVSQCYGGAIRCEGKIILYNSTFEGNHAYDYGGAIYSDTIEWNSSRGYSYFRNNYVNDNAGGAIYVNKFVTNDVVKYGVFIGNQAKGDDDGGAIYIYNENHITFSDCTFENNSAGDEGGAIYLDSTSSDLTLKNHNSFVNNHAGDEGQDVFNKGTYGTITLNWWGTPSPDFSKDRLIEWKFWQSNVKHKDTNPLTSPPNSNEVSVIVAANMAFVINYGGKYSITLKNKDGIPIANKDVMFILEGKDIGSAKTNSKGVATIKLTANTLKTVKLGNKNLVIKYVDPDNKTSSKKVKLTINKEKTKLAAKSITTTYNTNKKLVITLKDSKGKALSGVKVTVKLQGSKTYKTNKKGQIKVATAKLAPKKYTAKITFNGNTNYAKSTKSVKVVVKKATPKLTAKAKTFKKAVKTKKYSITLKTNLNKVMKNTKVTIKVNKKIYSAKTNKKGVATFKITKLTKKGKFTAQVKYAGSKYYNAKTVKVKITVK